MALRLALTFFWSWRTEIRDGLVSIHMEGALCLKLSWMSLTAGTRNWRLIVAVDVETNCNTDELCCCFVVGSELIVVVKTIGLRERVTLRCSLVLLDRTILSNALAVLGR